MKIQSIALVGLGAVGIMYARTITDALGKDILAVAADADRIRRYRSEGVYANERLCDFHYIDWEEAAPVDLVLFVTKYTSFAAAVAGARRLIGPRTILLSLLNGIVSEEDLSNAYGPDSLLYCTVQGMDATKEGNNVSYRNIGYFAIGEKDGHVSGRVLAVKELLESAGIPCRVPEDILRHQWSKMMLNAGINQVTAVYNATYGEVLQQQPLYQMMVDGMEEVQAIAAAEGICLTDQDILDWIDLVKTLAPEGTTSMCQDVRAGRKTEVDLFAGTAIRLGKVHGVPTPVNQLLYDKIREIEIGQINRF